MSLSDGYSNHNEVVNAFLTKINSTFDNIKKDFQNYIESELLKENLEMERRELLLVVKSELMSRVWDGKIIKMYGSGYKIAKEFFSQYKVNPLHFSENEKKLSKLFAPQENNRLFLSILTLAEEAFKRTETYQYSTAEKTLALLSQQISEEFLNHCYTSWERAMLDIKSEKPTKFPCFNDILKRVEKYDSSYTTTQIKFLKELNFFNQND